MTLRWVPAEHALEGPNDLVPGAVEGKRVERGPTGRGDAHHFATGPSKVVIPFFPPWVEQMHRQAGLRIARRLPRSLAQRTMNTGQGEIGERRRPARHQWRDMIDMKRGRLSEARKPAVFATIPRPQRHTPTKPGGNIHGI